MYCQTLNVYNDAKEVENLFEEKYYSLMHSRKLAIKKLYVVIKRIIKLTIYNFLVLHYVYLAIQNI